MMDMDFEKKLAIPMEVKAMYPLSDDLAETVARRAKELADVFTGASDKFLLIIGPCSADREDSVMDYITRLRGVQDRVAEKIFIVPRIYTSKPRTTGEGYKGMLHQPDPSGKPDLFRGIVAIRELLMRALRETGFSCADEMLYPENHKYIDDLLAYVTVGARSVEDQQHRLTASGLSIPVGMKNPTGGDIEAMMNAIKTAQNGHTFLYRGWQAHSHGNPLAHAVLRGWTDRSGRAVPNYHDADILGVVEAYGRHGLKNPALIIDANHANSGKQYLEQIRIVREVMESRRRSGDIRRIVKGFMIESYIEDGAQDVTGGCYGKSITDPCLGWEKSERLIYEIADAL